MPGNLAPGAYGKEDLTPGPFPSELFISHLSVTFR